MYCALSSDLTKSYGTDIVIEDLQQACLWNQTKDKSPKEWFDYIEASDELCPQEKIDRMCHSMALKKTNISVIENDQCVSATFESNGKLPYVSDDNSVLADHLAAWKEFGSYTFPAIAINGVKF